MLIPILVFVIIKSGLTHWIPTLQFLKKFIFTDVSDGFDKGADCFLVTTLEAAIHYISSLDPATTHLHCDGGSETDSVRSASDSDPRRLFSSKEDFVDYLFDRLKAEDEIEIIKLLKTDRNIEIESSGSSDSDDEVDNIGNGCNGQACGGASCNSACKLSTCRLNIQNRHGIGAVHVTAMHGLAKMLNVLLALEANPKIVDENNFTPLHYAAARGQQNTLLLLLHAGADINALTNDRFTPLHLSCLNGHENCVKALLYYSDHMRIRVDKNAPNKMGDTPLHLAAKWGFTEIVETLLEYGVKTDLVNRLGHTAHDYAHNSHILSLLQNVFVVIDRQSDTDETTSWDTSSSSSPVASQELFRGCITTSIDETDGESITGKSNNDKIVAAIRNGDTKLACYFLGLDIPEETETTDCHPLCMCDKCEHINRVQANQRKINENAQSPLARRYTGDINEPSTVDGGMTPLNAATQGSHIELMEHCFKLGASASQPSAGSQQTALHYAILTKCQKTTELVLSHINDDTDDINQQDADGNTAIHLAVQTGQAKLVECLLAHEPKLDLVNRRGQTAMDIAKASIQLNVVRLLEMESE